MVGEERTYMRKFLLAFILSVFISLTTAFIAFADFDPMDCLVDVYLDDEGAWWTIYDVSLIPADEVFSDDNSDSAPQKSPTKQSGLKSNGFVTTDNDMEIEISYDFADRDDRKYLDVTFEIGNGNETAKPATCVVALYEGLKFKKLVQNSTEVSAEDIEMVNLSIDITDCTDEEYVKIFIWDTFSTMRPLDELRQIEELNPQSSQKTILVSKSNNQIFNFYMYSGDKKNVAGKSHIISYNPERIQAVDLCGLSYEVELSTGAIENTDIIVDEFNPTIGKIVYKFNYDVQANERITGINNMIKFKALQALTNEQIDYIIE